MNKIQSITNYLRLRALSLGVMVLIFAILLPNITHAQVLSGVEGFLWNVVNVLFGWMVWFGGTLLDYTINNFVIGFGSMYATSGLGNTIDRLWVVVRDIFNLTFIFGLVLIGLRMIFDSSNSSTRKTLVYLIIAALLVNFSLFITKFIIDFSNIAAAQLATAFQVGGTGAANVSGRFMHLMGLTGLFDAAGNFAHMRGGSGMGYILGSMILYIVSAFVFLGGALLLSVRFVVLNIYMVLSPIMFLGWVFPSMASVSSEYWKGFLGRAFFAPAYLLMLYFAQSVLNTFSITNVAGGNNGLASIFGQEGPTSFAQVVPPFVLTAVFLIASLVVAQKMGANGASGVMAVGKSLTGKAKQYTKQAAWGTTKFTASQTGGRVARSASYALGNTLSRQVDRFQNSNNRIVRGLARTTGVDSIARGSAAKLQNTRFGLSQTREQEQAASNKIYQAADNRQQEQQAAQQVRANVLTAASTDVDITNRQNARQAHATEVGKMSNEQIVERARQDRAYVMSPEFASLLTDANVTTLRNSGIYNNTEMTQLEQNRTAGSLNEIDQVLINSNASVDNLNTAIDNLNRTVSTMSDQRILEMNAAERNNPAFAASMTQAQFDNFIGSNASPADKNALRGWRTAGQLRVAQHGSLVDPASPGAASPGAIDPGVQDRNRRRMFKNAQQAGALPAAVLRDPAVAEYLTPRIIEEFLGNNPAAGDITDVRTNVMDYITDPATPANITDTWNNWMNTTVLGRRFR